MHVALSYCNHYIKVILQQYTGNLSYALFNITESTALAQRGCPPVKDILGGVYMCIVSRTREPKISPPIPLAI